MPKLEPKIIQRELEKGLLWPVYWLYGQERMKSRELLKRIRSTVQAASAGSGWGASGWGEDTFDGSESDVQEILCAAKSPALGGGLRFVVVREAQNLKELEEIAELFGPAAAASELTSVCVFLAKDLDGRKKISKLLLDQAAVVPCEEVPESEREAWIQYLSKRKGVVLEAPLVAQLAALDPWSLDGVDQELEKFSLSSDPEAMIAGAAIGGGEKFMDAFFTRKKDQSLAYAETFSSHPEIVLPLLGLLTWNVRQLSTQNRKLNPYLLEKLQRWARHWRPEELSALQSDLAAIDFSLKQTPLLPTGLWDELVIRFTR